MILVRVTFENNTASNFGLTYFRHLPSRTLDKKRPRQILWEKEVKSWVGTLLPRDPRARVGSRFFVGLD